MKMELRVAEAKLASNSDGSLKVSGYVNKTNQLSNVLGVTKRFKEKIAKGAFSRAIRNASKDIDFLAEHDSKKILASTRNNSLTLREDNEGLYMEATITPTSWGKDTYELINSGIFRNMSFGFRSIRDSWKHLGSNLYERTIDELELYEVSVVKNPAYSQSTIAARSIELIEEPEIHIEEEKEEERELPLNVREAELRLEIPKVEGTIRSMESMSKVIPDSSSLLFVLEREKQKLNGLKEEFEDIKNQMEEIKMKKQTEERDLIIKDGRTAGALGQTIGGPIIQKLENTSSAYAKARKIPFTGESMKIPFETEFEDAKFVQAEGYFVPEINLNLSDLGELKQKRVGLQMSFSRQAMYDSGVNLSDYVKSLLTRRVAKAIEKSILAGKEADEFKGIAPDTSVASSPLATTTIISDNLREIYLNIHEDFIQNGTWYMSRPFFEKVSFLLDGSGAYLVKHNRIGEKIVPTLFGSPIEISNALDAGDTTGHVPVLFGSIEDCYTIGVSKDYQVKEVTGDTTNALRGSVALLAEFYGDGMVTNYQAIAKGVVA